MTRPSPDHVDEILAQWRRERPDLDASPIGVFGRLSRADRLVDTALAEGIAAHGLQPGWFDLLAALRRQGAPYELTPTQADGGDPALVRGHHQAAGPPGGCGADRTPARPDDRRGTLVRLTRQGKRVIDRALQTHLENERRLLQVFSRDQQRTFEGLLRTLLDGLDAADPAT